MPKIPCLVYLLFLDYFILLQTNKITMDKNIKIVWILTIITSLLMIGGQSYWLYNQYNFSALEYMQPISCLTRSMASDLPIIGCVAQFVRRGW